jgi:hypothetical protein
MDKTRLPTGTTSADIGGSLSPENERLLASEMHQENRFSIPQMPVLPPATASSLRPSPTCADDYFVDADLARRDVDPPTAILRHSSEPIEVGETVSVPALPRRVCLTRQSSSPLPSTKMEPTSLTGRHPKDIVTAAKTARAAKEEQMFAELEYLAPPNPPDELERRRALYKCVVLGKCIAASIDKFFGPGSDLDLTSSTQAQS